MHCLEQDLAQLHGHGGWELMGDGNIDPTYLENTRLGNTDLTDLDQYSWPALNFAIV